MANRANTVPVDQVTARVLGELGDWARGQGPRYRRLARALTAAVERGSLGPGDRLPAERALAGALAVSRGTVVAAYDLLLADGVVRRRVGSGTFVAPSAVGLPEDREGSGLVAHLAERDEVGLDGALIDLSLSVLPDAAGLPEVTLRTEDLAVAGEASGYGPWGRPSLRGLLADLLGRWGLPSTPDQIVVTTGAQQALSLTAACWVRPGDPVVLDDPTYPGAPAAFRAAGARPVAVPARDGLPDHGAFATALAEGPALAYVQSGVHSPTGRVAGPGRRRAVAGAVVGARVPLVEDFALAGLAWGRLPPPVSALTGEHPGAVVASLSKLLWGGLRLGFVRAPQPVAARLARVKATHDLGTSVVSQLLAEAWLTHPDLPDALARRDADLRHRHDVLVAALAERLPAWRVAPADGGLSLWVRLPAPRAEALGQVALRHGVAVATPSSLSPGGGHGDHLRLSFAAPPATLERGVERLAAAWSEVGAR